MIVKKKARWLIKKILYIFAVLIASTFITILIEILKKGGKP